MLIRIKSSSLFRVTGATANQVRSSLSGVVVRRIPRRTMRGRDDLQETNSGRFAKRFLYTHFFGLFVVLRSDARQRAVSRQLRQPGCEAAVVPAL